jgi:ABC-2 type transport system ATP-binding protein
MSGFSNLEMLNVMGMPISNKEIMKVVKLVGLENRIHDKVRIYSMGMKQRLALAAALLHKPKLLILDEPTNGLDPQGIYEFRKIIKNLSEVEGISVLISSHLISEVQLMCQKVAIINQGEIIASASVDSLITSNDIIWETDDNLKAIEILKPYVKKLKIVDDMISGSSEEEQLPELNRLLFHENIIVKQVYVKEKTLEELFLELTKNQGII